MKKLLGLILVALLLAACSKEPAQSTFIDLREYSEYSTATLHYACEEDEPMRNKVFTLNDHSWVIDIQHLEEEFISDCNEKIFPVEFFAGSGLEELEGAWISYITLSGADSAGDIDVTAYPIGGEEGSFVQISFSNDTGRGSLVAESPRDFGFEELIIAKGWVIIRGDVQPDGHIELKHTDINSVKWELIPFI